jgi:formiminoglutamase
MRFTLDSITPFSTGDSLDPRFGDFVELVTFPVFERRKWDWAIIGLPDDRGVRLNGGRPGAAEGPAAIRKWFQRLVWTAELAVADLGDLLLSDDLDGDHQTATAAIAAALGHADRVAILGGGHDWGFCPISALMQGGTTAFINFDAHLDVRPSKVHHSGTSYWRALEAGIVGGNATWVGVQRSATAEAHRQYVDAHGGRVYWSDETAATKLSRTGYDYLDVSLDMDVFSLAHAPGVSAPQALGLSPATLLPVLEAALRLPNLRTFGIYETAPLLDNEAEATSRLAARCLWQALMS